MVSEVTLLDMLLPASTALVGVQNMAPAMLHTMVATMEEERMAVFTNAREIMPKMTRIQT